MLHHHTAIGHMILKHPSVAGFLKKSLTNQQGFGCYASNLFHTMTSSRRPDHIEITAQQAREAGVFHATITRVDQLSPTVRGLQLSFAHQSKGPNISFKAGQWVDFFAPGVSTIGGFSMSSAPYQLEEEGTLDLAIKVSNHPPAKWVHSDMCKEGATAHVRVGGDFHYNPTPTSPSRSLLLLAGGVGINPIVSVMRHAADLRLRKQNGEKEVHQPGNVILLYSAAKAEELIYKDVIDKICEIEGFSCIYHVTKETAPLTAPHRISQESIGSALSALDCPLENVSCYLCGPGQMLDTLEEYLTNENVHKQNIHYEKWW